MRCARCRAENTAAARFCEDCGARLEQACPNCGESEHCRWLSPALSGICPDRPGCLRGATAWSSGGSSARHARSVRGWRRRCPRHLVPGDNRAAVNRLDATTRNLSATRDTNGATARAVTP